MISWRYRREVFCVCGAWKSSQRYSVSRRQKKYPLGALSARSLLRLRSRPRREKRPVLRLRRPPSWPTSDE